MSRHVVRIAHTLLLAAVAALYNYRPTLRRTCCEGPGVCRLLGCFTALGRQFPIAGLRDAAAQARRARPRAPSSTVTSPHSSALRTRPSPHPAPSRRRDGAHPAAAHPAPVETPESGSIPLTRSRQLAAGCEFEQERGGWGYTRQRSNSNCGCIAAGKTSRQQDRANSVSRFPNSYRIPHHAMCGVLCVE